MCVMKDDFEWDFYKDSSSQWRWRCRATNGRIIGASSEGYHNKDDCWCNAQIFGFKPRVHHSTGLVLS